MKPVLHTPPAAVVKHSAAIALAGEVSLLQRRLWNVLLARAYDELPTGGPHHTTVAEICEALGREGNNTEQVKDALRSLVKTVVEWDALGRDKKSRWGVSAMLAEVEVEEGGSVTYGYGPTFARRLHAPEIYARISLSISNRFKSRHALSLYELAADYLGVGQTPKIELARFRRMMGLDEHEYPAFKELNRRVIQQAVEEINACSDVTMTVKLFREARAVVAVKFFVRAKKATRAAALEEAKARGAVTALLPPAGRSHEIAGEPDAFETWLDALSPLERGAFEARVETRLKKRGEADAPRGLARWQIAARELYEEEQGGGEGS